MSTYINSDHGYLGDTPSKPTYETMVIGGYAHRIHRVIVHRFRMGDCEDPDLYAAQPMWDWQQSDEGQWVMDHAVEPPEWHRQVDPTTYGYNYLIQAKLKGRDYTYWQVKWNKLST